MTAESHPPRDRIYPAIIGLVIVVVVWLLATPFVSAVAMAGMKRFHLRSGSFAFWSAQQFVPSMYNFGNTFDVSNIPPDMVNPAMETYRPRYLNHFPTRRLTFASDRSFLLHQGDHKWVTVKTTYRGQELTTRFHVNPVGDGAYELIRLDDEDAVAEDSQ